MRRYPYLLKSAGALFLLLMAACGGPTGNLTPTPTAMAGSSPSVPAAKPVAGSTQPGSPAAPASATQAASAPKPASSGPVALQVITPQDGAVVNAPQVQVSGSASPGAVVTVNDAIILVGADGAFSSTVSLDAGPNLIEVIASSNSGDTRTVDLTVIYQQ